MTKRSVASLLVVIAALAGTDVFAKQPQKRHPKADQAVTEELGSGKRLRVIVRGAAGTDLTTLKTKVGKSGRVRRHLRGIGAVAAEMTGQQIAALLKDAKISGVSIDAPLQTQAYVEAEVDKQRVRTTLGLNTYDLGRNVGIAIIDSGIAPTPDLQGRISAFYEFQNGVAVPAPPSDGYGHGTHIAGLIGGWGVKSDYRYIGTAPYARLIGLKVLDDNGSGYTSDVIAAIEFATEKKVALGIDVINLSLGHPIYEPAATDPMVQAVERAVRAGIVVVVSAGNHGTNPVSGQIGYAGITSPGNAPSAITVGTVRHKGTSSRLDDEVASFSSRGPTWYDAFVKPDILAPGQALVANATSSSKLYQNRALRVAGYPDYLALSGTSMSAGVVSGVVATIIEAKLKKDGRRLTPNTIKAILQFTAIPLADLDPSTPAALEQGAGALNAAGATALAKAINPAATTGSYWLTSGVTTATKVGGLWHPWSRHIVWGNHIVWGDTVFRNLEAWAQHIVWGDSTGSADHIVWGDDDHIVWGDNFLHGLNLALDSILAWSDHIVWGDDDHIVWGDNDHIVWGDLSDDHIVWGDSDHVVWGDNDQMVWGNSAGIVEGIEEAGDELVEELIGVPPLGTEEPLVVEPVVESVNALIP